MLQKCTKMLQKLQLRAVARRRCGTVYFFYCIFFYCTVFFSTVLYFFLLYCIFFYKSYNCEQESYNCEPFALQLRAKNLQKNLQLRATKSTKGDRPTHEVRAHSSCRVQPVADGLLTRPPPGAGCIFLADFPARINYFTITMLVLCGVRVH